MQLQVKARFSTVVQHAGTNIFVAGTPGELLTLEDPVAEAVLRDCGGCVERSEPSVEMAPGPSPVKAARARQVVKAPARKR